MVLLDADAFGPVAQPVLLTAVLCCGLGLHHLRESRTTRRTGQGVAGVALLLSLGVLGAVGSIKGTLFGGFGVAARGLEAFERAWLMEAVGSVGWAMACTLPVVFIALWGSGRALSLRRLGIDRRLGRGARAAFGVAIFALLAVSLAGLQAQALANLRGDRAMELVSQRQIVLAQVAGMLHLAELLAGAGIISSLVMIIAAARGAHWSRASLWIGPAKLASTNETKALTLWRAPQANMGPAHVEEPVADELPELSRDVWGLPMATRLS